MRVAVFVLLTLFVVPLAVAQPPGKNPEIVRINDSIYEAIGPPGSNTFLVMTAAGNVVIDTSNPDSGPRHAEALKAATSCSSNGRLPSKPRRISDPRPRHD